MSSAVRFCKPAALALAAVLLSVGLAQSAELKIDAGYNFLATTPDSYTTVSIPAGFFGEKNGVPSDPLVNVRVELVGRPTGKLGLSPASGLKVEAGNCHSRGGHHHCHEVAPTGEQVDTITRVSSARLDKIGDTAEVTLQIVMLSLETPESAPLEVTYGNQEPSSFRAILTLDEKVEQPVGSIRLHRKSEKGGIMEVELPVKFKVLFTGGRDERFGPVSLSTVLASDDNGFEIARQ